MAINNILDHRGFRTAVEFDADGGLFFGRVAGIRGGIGFHAETIPALVTAFREAVDDYLETCAKIGKTPECPYSGKVLLRIDPGLHASTAKAAELAGVSLNQWTEKMLRTAAGAQMPRCQVTLN